MKADLLEKREDVLALFDIYEPLLTEKQRRTFASYYRYDLSLAEIAEEEGVSRASVHDALTKTIKKLEEYESKLLLRKKREAYLQAIEIIAKETNETTKQNLLQKLKEDIEHGI